MFLWQDMPTGDLWGNSWDWEHMDDGTDKDRRQE